MQVALHPDVSRLTYKFGRIHHQVDYTSFKRLRLVRKERSEPSSAIDNYGMELVKVET